MISYEYMDNLKVFTKADYLRVAGEKRKEFIHKYFNDQLKEIFAKLNKEAENMDEVNSQISIIVPDHFSTTNIEKKFKEYFTDLGYTVLLEMKKDNPNEIFFTLI